MTRVPGPVKALGAICAFLTLSYAVSVWAAPRSGIEDLGTGGPEAVAGAYGRDPAPPVTWWRVGRSPSADGQAVDTDGEGARTVSRFRVAAPPLTPVSARTGSVEAGPTVVAAQGAPAIATPKPAAPVATSPPPVRPPQGGKDPSAEPPGSGSSGSGSSGNGSSGGPDGPRHHGSGSGSGSGGCGGGSGGTAARGVAKGPAPTPAVPRKPVAQPHRRGR